MPPKQSAGAWEDDWETIADKQVEAEQRGEPAPKVKLSQKERRAQHAQLQKELWQTADNPEPMLFLETRNSAPVQPTFKPTVTLLARKPKGATDEDSDEERRKKNEAEFEERKARAQMERAEKERRYAEAREKIFGASTPATSDESRGASPRRGGKGRGRGGRDSQPRSSNEQSPARPSASRQLFEPAYSPKPGSVFVHKKESSTSRPSTPSIQEKPIREPRGPQSSIRGGRGFAPRGGRFDTVP